ncbi:MAG: sigma-54-dependent Fis family transcriptional regulator, partial [Phycisphaeraceae bacterium]|nr:sigma-54-dependent Fis family transcriptional regulator [Phycisphaeraceae bacterium]
QERRFEPVGSTKTVEVDARVVLASNQPLEDLVARGQFRQDLYYRINVVKIELPPLRERVGDVPMLAEKFLERYAAEAGRQIAGISGEAMEALRRYPFPGNVRELENVIQRAVVLTKGQTIRLEDLPPHVTGEADAGVLARLATGTVADDEAEWRPMALEDALREPERRIILRALEANNWNRQKTADDLRINRTTLYKKMKALGIEAGEEAA